MREGRIVRLSGEPIIRPHMDRRMGSDINGPSLIRAPGWLEEPIGRYYLYLAGHKGGYIRLAFADALAGPWRIHTPGTLALEQSHFATERPNLSAVTEIRCGGRGRRSAWAGRAVARREIPEQRQDSAGRFFCGEVPAVVELVQLELGEPGLPPLAASSRLPQKKT